MKYTNANIPPVTKLKNLHIVRGDQIAGGLKRPVLERVLAQIDDETIVYPGDGYGSAGEALALACQATQKKLHLLLPDTGVKSSTLDRTTALPNVVTEVMTDVRLQIDLIAAAQKLPGYNMPIGCRTPKFVTEMIQYLAQTASARDLPTKSTMWYAAGSGTLGQTLMTAFPETELAIANLGFPQLDLNKHPAQVYNVNRSEIIKPPVPTNPDYDQHLWPIIKKHAKPGDVVWNYAR